MKVDIAAKHFEKHYSRASSVISSALFDAFKSGVLVSGGRVAPCGDIICIFPCQHYNSNNKTCKDCELKK